MGERAVSYRRINGIPDEWGTAVNVQQMVYGNLGETSGSGVAFSRNELTGAPEYSGDFLSNAQGEDVVSGVRTPRDLSELRDWMPDAAGQLDRDSAPARSATTRTCRTRSSRSRRGACTCCRRAAPSAPPRPRCASRSTPSREGLLTRAEAIATIDAGSLDALLHPTFDPDAELRGARPRRRRFARRRQGSDRLHRPGGGRRRRRRDPGPAVHGGRGCDRLSRRQGDPHLRGRQGFPRGSGGARHGPARRHRGGRAGRRPSRRRAADRRARPAPRRSDRDRRQHRRDHHR